MRLNKFFMLGLAGLAFAACSSNEDVDSAWNSTKEKSVEVSIANATYNAGSGRAVANGFTDKNATIAVATAQDLKFIFLVGDRIQDVRTIDNSVSTKQSTAGNNVYTFHEVDGSVNHVAIVGKLPNSVKLNVNANYNEFLTNLKSAASVQDQQKDLAAITVLGDKKQLQKVTEADDKGHSNVWSAGQIEVKPLLARLEIGKIGCTNLGGTADASGVIPLYSELTLGKIGIDNVNTSITAGLFNYADTGTPEEITAGEAAWKADTKWSDSMNNCVLNSSTAVDPQTYAYNVVPGTTPRIILQIDAYQANAGVVDPAIKNLPWYVKANSYTGADLANGFQAGSIYQVNFQFTDKNIKPWHPVDPICVQVEVVIPNWTIVELTPQFQ